MANPDYEYSEYKQQIVPEDFIQAIEANGGSKEFVDAIRAQNKRHQRALDSAWRFEKKAYMLLAIPALVVLAFLIYQYV